MATTADRAESLVKRISERAKEFADQGMKSEAFGLAAGAVLSAQIAKVLERIEKLESEQALLADRGLKYCGTWQRALDYRRGDCVTHKGSLWTAVKATNKAPDEAASDWQLSAKGAQR
ncbi:hypothetical protein [Pseudomonas sp. Q1-7]|uniref:hypothetical protein n=1 Tax=Pseudomonas sp. Q1-7 TaxID=3020843 RepID=UPI0023002F34|nr:hypothetical protein [Pseudomonas sp. Q1-7]